MRIDVARAASALELLGWDTARAASFEPYAGQGLAPGRVAVQHRGGCVVRTEHAQTSAGISGKLRHEATGPADFPAVGDWVALADGVVQAILPRRTAFVRRAPGPGGRIEEQVLAANIDVAFLVSALTRDLNPRRIERYLATAWESGAEPVVVLTKSDLCLDLTRALAEVEAVASGVPVHHVSAITGDGVDELKGHLAGHRTAALLGSSGVGKSTLTNRLIGRDLLQNVRSGRYCRLMLRAGWVKPESDQRLSDHISIGVLTRVFAPELVDRVVAEAGRTERRQRLLPARVVVYYVLALALFGSSSYEEVMRMLVQGLSWASGWRGVWSVPSKAAIFKARRLSLTRFA